MSRKPRQLTENGIYHIILRGNNQQNLFVDKKDRCFFIKKLRLYSKELDIAIYGYCLMSNHVHILLKTEKHLSLFVQKIANSYVYFFNRKYERTGHLFQGRFKSEPVDDEIYLKTVLRYIIQNPTKSGISDFKTYPWSNFKTITEKIEDGITNIKVLEQIFETKSEIKTFLLQQEGKKCMEYENKFILNDERCIELIKKLFHLRSPYKLMQLDIDNQIIKIKQLKKIGISQNQISLLHLPSFHLLSLYCY